MDTISDIVVYENGEIELKISPDKDTIWASINDIAKVFDIDRSVVSKHIKNIFKDNELDEKVVCANFAHTTKHGSLSDKSQTRDIKYYNLDIVLAVGYRTSSNKAIHFRQWATSVLKSYIQNGYAINTHKISKELQLDIQKYNKQYSNLQAKITKNFHDRFLICDETVYHFGASFKDLGNKIFAVNKMNILVNDLLKNI